MAGPNPWTNLRHFPWATRLSIAIDVCDAMAYLHATETPEGKKKKDLFHQDLKSNNVLLSIDQETGLIKAKM